MFRLKQFFLKRKAKKINQNEIIWQEEKDYIQRQNIIDAEKKELEEAHKKITFPSWSKLLLGFLFINFTILEGFILWISIKSFEIAQLTGTSPDFLPLVTLIGAVIGETISYGIYSAKSKAENTTGGIVFETAMRELEADSYESCEDNSDE